MKCYGRNLASDRQAQKEGDALGIIAAQSIGEPGTQLDHAVRSISAAPLRARKQAAGDPPSRVMTALIKLFNVRTIKNQKGKTVVVNKNGYVIVYDPNVAKEAEKTARERAQIEAEALGTVYNKDYDFWGDALKEAELDRYELEAGSVIDKNDGDSVKANEVFVQREANHVPIIIEEAVWSSCTTSWRA
ncbi:MAG: hypothetical protein V8T86_07235 [Victivallis sp.]